MDRKTIQIDAEVHTWIKHNYLRYGFKTMAEFVEAAINEFEGECSSKFTQPTIK